MNRRRGLPAGRQGFTLIELMIVMVIMGILAAIGVTAFMSSQKKGRDAARKGNLNAISKALELYYNDKVGYPIADSGYIKACISGVVVKCDGTDVAHKKMTDGTTMYMANVPVDPISTQRYWYVSNGKQYQLYAHLENDSASSHDPQIDPDIVSKKLNCVPSSDTAYCNYGISSGNVSP